MKKIFCITILTLYCSLTLFVCASSRTGIVVQPDSEVNKSTLSSDNSAIDKEKEELANAINPGILDSITSSFRSSGYMENQPELVTEGDDPFFTLPPEYPNELFRVLIAGGNYQVRQIDGMDVIKRRADISGDKYKAEFFAEYSERYDFMNWNFRGTLKVQLDPENGSIKFVGFRPGKTPNTWQASYFFKEDLARFVFEFLDGVILEPEFYVTYEWRIEKRSGLSDSEARTRAIEFLKSQKSE